MTSNTSFSLRFRCSFDHRSLARLVSAGSLHLLKGIRDPIKEAHTGVSIFSHSFSPLFSRIISPASSPAHKSLITLHSRNCSAYSATAPSFTFNFSTTLGALPLLLSFSILSATNAMSAAPTPEPSFAMPILILSSPRLPISGTILIA